ncbi:HvfC/BufC N-terminal domain-containing protein [Methylomonas albis]|uniref:DNA-binding domain-containing protein n=1 Tax=Methylomonas albis TaxID=1854563 RepID=A0ABR9D3V4_9GAMM|nr:DNA-binding domain-containing protein [Methylomonas albis]MBD9357812.1 putative DNA-binding domain-containing protein [Methylomonas albis]
MYRLHDLQRDFSRFVCQETQRLPPDIMANGLSAAQRLSIYRNNTRLGLTEALRDTYPVVNCLVGDAFFNRLAADYVKCYPLQAASLLTYGGHFAELIARFEAAQDLPYLADIARLEWLWHEAYHAGDAQPLPLSALARIDPAQYAQLAFRLHPSARVIASDYPIERIWASNQPEYQGREYIDLVAGGCRLLLYRPQWQVEIHYLAADEYQFLTLLGSGQALNQAVETVMRDHPDINIPLLLQQWLRKGLLTDFYLV